MAEKIDLDLVALEEKSTANILDKITMRMQQAFSQTQTSTNSGHDNFNTKIGVKLDGTNYTHWSQVMEMYIMGKDKLGYITGDVPRPELVDPTFQKQRTENVVIKGWLINLMNSSLIINFI